MDVIDSGDILVVKGSQIWAYFGELMSTISDQRNSVGVVILGKARDIRLTGALLLVWSDGYTPVDIKDAGG